MLFAFLDPDTWNTELCTSCCWSLVASKVVIALTLCSPVHELLKERLLSADSVHPAIFLENNYFYSPCSAFLSVFVLFFYVAIVNSSLCSSINLPPRKHLSFRFCLSMVTLNSHWSSLLFGVLPWSQKGRSMLIAFVFLLVIAKKKIRSSLFTLILSSF